MHDTGKSLTLFNTSQRADSSESIPNSIRPLVVELLSFLILAARAPNTQSSYRGQQTWHHLKPYTNQLVSVSGFQRIHPRPNPPTGCRAILLFNLLTATEMPQPQAIYHPIHLSERIQVVCFPTRSVCWMWRYLSFSMCPDTVASQNVNY